MKTATLRLPLFGGLLYFLLSANTAFAQSSSNGEVSTIESLVSQILSINKQIEAVKKRLTENEEKVAEYRRKILAIPDEVAKIEREKQQMIDECRRGLYCDQCKDSKSEIEASGNETFQAHLRRVGGQAIPLPEEEIKKKEKVFDDRIAAVRAKLPQLQASKTAEEDKWALIKQEQLDLEDKLPDLKQKIAEHCRLWKEAREKEHDDAYGRWVNMLLPPITEAITNKCQTDKMTLKHSEFLSNADRLIWNLGLDFENAIDNKINKTSLALNTQTQETNRLRNQKTADLNQIMSLIEKREDDSLDLVKDFRNLNPKAARDTFNFRNAIRDIGYEIQSKRVEYNRVKLNWDSVQIKQSVIKEGKLQDSIYTMRRERFSRVLAFKERLKTRKNKGDSLFIKAIAAMKKQVSRIESETEQAKNSVTNSIANFNSETARQQSKISGLLGQVGLYNNYGVSKYQEWSVVENIKSSLKDAASSALNTGEPFTPIIENNIDKSFNRTTWSSKIISTCNEDKTSGFDTMKDVALNNRIKALQDRFN